MIPNKTIIHLTLALGLGHASAQMASPPKKVNQAPAKAVDLPGVMQIEGEPVQALESGRARTIQMSNGGAQPVFLSATEPNRIQLPFVNPHIVATNEVRIERRSTSNNIYVAFNAGVKRAVPIFIESSDGVGPVLGLQLIPKEIIAQTIIVEDVTPRPSPVSRSKEQKSSDYIESVQDLMEAVANNDTPQGFSIVALTVPPIAMNGLLVEVEKKLSGKDRDFFIYRVTNPSGKSTIVKEEEFDGDMVLAVSIHPKSNLSPGQSTKVVVMASKTKGR